jgi:hypothetical protein
VVEGSKSFVRIILRRPQTYEFRDRFKKAPIPGLVFMDAEKTVKETLSLEGKITVDQVAEAMKGSSK